MAELAEGARLLSEYGGKLPSRVRIPLSPPHAIIPEINYISGFLLLEFYMKIIETLELSLMDGDHFISLILTLCTSRRLSCARHLRLRL